MKRNVLSLLLCGLLACSMLTACGGSNSSNDAGVNNIDVSEKKDVESDSSNIEDLYVEAINSYQDYYEKVKSDFTPDSAESLEPPQAVSILQASKPHNNKLNTFLFIFYPP